MSYMAKERLYQGAIGISLLLLSIGMLYPFLYIFFVSFTDNAVFVANKLVLWPERWSLNAYWLILSASGFKYSLESSLFITAIGTPVSIAVSAMMAYMLSKKGLPARNVMITMVVCTIIFSPGLIPEYLLVRNLGLLDTRWSLILTAATNGWTILVMKSFFQSLPGEVEESAKIDGCNDLGVFFRVVAPLSKAPMAAFTLFFAVYYWNIYFKAILFLNDSTLWPLQVFLQQIISAASVTDFASAAVIANVRDQMSINPEIVKMAAVIIVMMPILVVYPFLQKHFAKGVLLGSVKG